MVYIGIGSNLGNRIKNINKAKYLLSLNGINILKSSSYYESLSWPDQNHPKFINIVIHSDTNILPKKILQISQSIENKLGRKKTYKNAPRTCDIDILTYKNKVISGDITIPHNRMSKRNFVLIPLFEIAPNFVHPKTNITIKKLIFSLSNKDITSIKLI
tara:strand:- start:476 stop:952 length:477 start_codon:yes stop_codon:yes gene_type:complete